jgi:hypothetical protein
LIWDYFRIIEDDEGSGLASPNPTRAAGAIPAARQRDVSKEMAKTRSGGPNQHQHSQMSFDFMTCIQPQQQTRHDWSHFTSVHTVRNRVRFEQK